MKNWSHLHWSMLNLVATNLTNIADHLAFSAVCSSWRSVALDIRPTFPCPFPHLLVRGKDDDGYCISLSNEVVLDLKLHIPLEDWYIGTYGGWLVTVHKNLDMSLYNPFSGEILPLPSILSVPKLGEGEFPLENNIYVESAALSSLNVNLNPKDLTVMIAQGAYKRLAFAKSGDSSWQIIDNDEYLFYSGVVFYKRNFYAVGKKGTVICDIGINPKTSLIAPKTKIRTDLGHPSHDCIRSYLVESREGDLIMVERWIKYNDEDNSNGHLIFHDIDDNNSIDDNTGSTIENKSGVVDGDTDVCVGQNWTYMTSSFNAYKMDFVGEQWVPIEGIGDDQVLFVGFNNAFALKVQTGEGNRIYFTDDYAEGQECEMMDNGKLYRTDMGMFNFNDGTISPHINIGGDATLFPPPMWAIPLPW